MATAAALPLMLCAAPAAYADTNDAPRVEGVLVTRRTFPLTTAATLADASVSWPQKTWAATVGVQNIFDRPNFLYGDGAGGGAAPGPGRTVYVKLSIHG